MKNVIKAENLSKKYLISHQNRQGYTTLRDTLTQKARGFTQRMTHPFGASVGSSGQISSMEEFWALKDISFDIHQGDRVGIIGRNGAGKSTLLKVLSRITEPTHGKVTIEGRVASLLEVGTGFHPELTGRENIYFNGAVLGMKKVEISKKFDEIVAFSEVEKFLDTPVKRYSSGMYVRLAFAVAAHLDPEILIVDEVLAVGDSHFQKKCLGKMEAVGEQGRTILFVSHNMAAVQNLCNTGIVIDRGLSAFQGEVTQAITTYFNTFSKNENDNLEVRKDRQGKGRLRISQIEIEDAYGNKNVPFKIGSELSFQLHYKVDEAIRKPRIIIGIYDNMGVGITRFDTNIVGDIPDLLTQSGSVTCTTGGMNVTPGQYFINVAFISNEEMEDYLIHAATLEIASSDFYKTGRVFDRSDSRLTKVLIRHDWKFS